MLDGAFTWQEVCLGSLLFAFYEWKIQIFTEANVFFSGVRIGKETRKADGHLS